MKLHSIAAARLGVFLLSVLLTPGSVPCQQSTQSKNSPSASADAAFPGFTVAMTYSDSAKKTLLDRKETVIVAGYLDGFPAPGAQKKYIDKEGKVGLDDITKEVLPGQNATFETIKIKKEMLLQLDTQGPQLLINVYSGRKSSENNLLDCGIYEGSLQSVEGKTIPIACKLIGE